MTAATVRGAFHSSDGRLACGDHDVEWLAHRVGTPLYVYSAEAIRARYRQIAAAFAAHDALVCYSVKSNANLAVLDVLRREGAGFDIVSEGELFRACQIGVDPARIVFAGTGKSDREIRAALCAGVGLLNVESVSELVAIDRLACELDRRAAVLLRINPDVDAHTHPHITTGRHRDKFGIDRPTARKILASRDLYRRVDIRGFHVHIGSQITDVRPFVAALERVGELVAEARALGATIDTLNLGGGLGIDYGSGGLDVFALAEALGPGLTRLRCRTILEPGRAIVGAAGALITEVLHVKASADRRFVVVDAGMTELIRPALYDAWHRIEPVLKVDSPLRFSCDVVGPICESADFLARDRELPALARGDLLAVLDAGAYGFSMASNYNSRPRPAEVLVDGSRWWIVRRREEFADLTRGEELPIATAAPADCTTIEKTG